MPTPEKQSPLVNIDFAPIASVANNLFDKLEHAVGWVATHDTPNRHAIQHYIKEVEVSDLDPLIKAAKISNARRDIKQYINQQKTINQAIAQLPPNSNPDNLDDDWLNFFMDKIRFVNSDELQAIWSRILAQECETPESIPLQLLDILSTLSRNLAEKFLILCGFTANLDGETIPIVDIMNSNYYSKKGLTPTDIFNLDSVGLVSFTSAGYIMSYNQELNPITVKIKDQTFFVSFQNDEISYGSVSFTYCGDALFKILAPITPDDFPEFCLAYWKERCGATFTMAPE